MDTNLIRSWLDLPTGPWPPDDRALLGLPAGPVDAADAERRALTLMGRLRPHQLVHPELVTEGMNRIAQALLAVTATAAVPPRPAAPAPRSIASEGDLEPQAIAVRLEPEPVAPTVLESAADAVAVVVVESAPPTLDFSRVEAIKLPPSRRPIPLQVPITVSPTPIPVGPRPEHRRAAYRELAGLRGLVHAWDRLRATLADPSAGLTTPGEVFEFLEGVQAVRAATIHPGLDPATVRDTAPAVAAISRQPLPLAVFRSLVPAQRQALARDWAAGRARFVTRSAALRLGVERAISTRPSVTAAGLLHTIARNPEWGLVAASGLVLTAVAIRLVSR